MNVRLLSGTRRPSCRFIAHPVAGIVEALLHFDWHFVAFSPWRWPTRTVRQSGYHRQGIMSHAQAT